MGPGCPAGAPARYCAVVPVSFSDSSALLIGGNPAASRPVPPTAAAHARRRFLRVGRRQLVGAPDPVHVCRRSAPPRVVQRIEAVERRQVAECQRQFYASGVPQAGCPRPSAPRRRTAHCRGSALSAARGGPAGLHRSARPRRGAVAHALGVQPGTGEFERADGGDGGAGTWQLRKAAQIV